MVLKTPLSIYLSFQSRGAAYLQVRLIRRRLRWFHTLRVCVMKHDFV